MIALAAVFLIWVVPYVFIKHLSWGVRREGARHERLVALTFDDGPNPESTPRILEILARHRVHATFFVVGEAADAHPELARRILAEGHALGSHSYRHRHALFHRPPLQGFFDTRKGVARLRQIIGKQPHFFRPPWGAYSWSVLCAIWLERVRPIHWTVESHDWHPRFRPADVVRKVLAEVHPGAVICMHDSGRGATRSVHALDQILRGLAAQRLRPALLSEMELRSGFPWRALRSAS
jgi:peptidoglycan/xylan/chitin deacetylase (PgdA/CDA1 family)